MTTSKLEVHLDTDEGNACNMDAATRIELLKQDWRLRLQQDNRYNVMHVFWVSF